ncbi:MAG: Ig-like domain-containing protein [candidate division Zixibacteria bacterium]|nr:Ig-like domain-containing protein [candidate division Zixibacteria bacterium]
MIRPYSRAFAVIAASIYFMILAGCGGGDSGPTSPTPPDPTPPAPPPTPVATSLTVAPSSHTLASIGATVQLSATVRDQNNNPMTGQTVTRTSGNTGIATVSGNGLVTAVSNGTTQITARSGNASGTANITVAEPVPTRIAVTPSSHTLEAIGATVQPTATVRDQRNNVMSGQTITWSSGDVAVATVSGTGLVTAVGNGMAEITARSGSLSANATISVASPVPTSIMIEPASYTLEMIGATVQLTATVRDQNENVMEDVTVTWSSGDESVATVSDQGLVTAGGNGIAEITAQAGDAMGTAAITVSEPVATSITIEPSSHTFEAIGDTLQMAAVVLDQHDNVMSEVTVLWSSGDESVATVDANGLVTAVGNGMTEISARVGDAMGSAEITVAVPDPVATSLTIEPASQTLEMIGATVQLTATVLDQYGNAMVDVTVVWSSGDEAVATVDDQGLVTAVGNGMAEITAQAGNATGTAAITVSVFEPVATNLTIEPASHTLAMIGATVQLTATVRDQNNNVMSDVTVTWSSDDEAVATVDANGLVIAVDNGMTEITAQAEDAMGTATITVSVFEPVATSITIQPAAYTLEMIGATVQLTASVRDQNENVMADVTVSWSSGDESVATVDANGLVIAVGNGMAEITAQAGAAMGTATISVAEPVATSLTIEPTSHTLESVGASVQLTAKVFDQHGNTMMDVTVSWSSGDESVATVDANGLVTAVDNGMTEITAQAGDAMGTSSITVSLPVATSISIEPGAHTLESIGATVQLTASVFDQHENTMMDETVTWSSGDESVSTVDADGLVTAVDNGMTEITAQAGDAMGTASITVSQVPANISIEVDANATTLTEIGQTLQLMVSISDANDEPIAEPDVKWTSSDEAVVTVDEDGLVEAVGDGMAEVTAASGDVSDKVSITVTVPVPVIEYVPWEGVTVERGKLIFSTSGGLGLEIEYPDCFTNTRNPLAGFLGLPPEGLKDWTNSFTNDTLTVHYSEWQRSDDMGSTWESIEGTRVMYDACTYDPEVAGEYRLVGEITLNGEMSHRRSENTFTIDP